MFFYHSISPLSLLCCFFLFLPFHIYGGFTMSYGGHGCYQDKETSLVVATSKSAREIETQTVVQFTNALQEPPYSHSMQQDKNCLGPIQIPIFPQPHLEGFHNSQLYEYINYIEKDLICTQKKTCIYSLLFNQHQYSYI